VFERVVPDFQRAGYIEYLKGRRFDRGHGGGRLENHALIALLAGDSLAVKILEQRDRILAGEPRELFETSHIQQTATKGS
jgi:hypothetical protein